VADLRSENDSLPSRLVLGRSEIPLSATVDLPSVVSS
jgi:hypothetical protein